MNCQSFTDNNISRDYPIRSIGQAYGILRGYRIGPLSSKQINPEQSSKTSARAFLVLAGSEGATLIEGETREHAIWVELLRCFVKLRTRYDNDIRFQAFCVHHIGETALNSDTGDVSAYTIGAIARRVGKAPRTVYRWIERVEDDFIKLLTDRGLLEPQRTYETAA